MTKIEFTLPPGDGQWYRTRQGRRDCPECGSPVRYYVLGYRPDLETVTVEAQYFDAEWQPARFEEQARSFLDLQPKWKTHGWLHIQQCDTDDCFLLDLWTATDEQVQWWGERSDGWARAYVDLVLTAGENPRCEWTVPASFAWPAGESQRLPAGAQDNRQGSEDDAEDDAEDDE